MGVSPESEAGGSSGEMNSNDTAEDRSVCDQVFSVTLPANTPIADTIYMAGTFFADEDAGQNWQPNERALSRIGNVATLTLSVRSGQWLSYKYTRGSWPQVEVLANCSERQNRNLLVRCPTSVRMDTVQSWGDVLPCQ